MSGWRSRNDGVITVNRSSKEELDKAIKENEKRGYKVISAPQSSNILHKHFEDKQSRFPRRKYYGAELFEKWTVMMKREEEKH
jgi:hypothetical protein